MEKFTGLIFDYDNQDDEDFDLLIRVISNQRMDEIEEEDYERNKDRWASKRSLGCYVATAKSRIRGYIYRGEATLRRNNVNYCGQHELMHVLGFGGHFWKTDPSVLYVHRDTNDLSLNDKLLMRTLYDDRIKPDMDRTRVMAVAQKIVTELVADVEKHGERSLYHPLYLQRTAALSD